MRPPERRDTRRSRWALAMAVLLLAGCTRVVDDAQPLKARPVAPITAGQVSDLLSEDAEPDPDSNLFATAMPAQCAGLIREVDPPFVFGMTTPVAHDAEGWDNGEADPGTYISVEEMVGVYAADFDPVAAVDAVRRTVAYCARNSLTATAQNGARKHFRAIPTQDSGAPEIVLWSVSGSWACDDAFIAAHNAAIEITTCGEYGGYDVLTLAKAALERINKLANMAA